MKWIATAMAGSLLLAACGSEKPTNAMNDSEPDNSVIENAAVTAWPTSLAPFGDGYPNTGDPCRRVGESAATSNYLDDSADLVGCPSAAAAAALGGKAVATVDGITLVSVPSSGTAGPIAAADAIRGAGGLEAKCKVAVAKETGARVIGTNRIEESQAAVEVYLNVEGAQAPWKCRGTRDGKVEGVEYSGDEGAL